MNKYYYLDISLLPEHSSTIEFTTEIFKHIIITAIEHLFGEVGSSINIDVIRYNPKTNRAILRVPHYHYIKLRTSLTLFGEYQNESVKFNINKASPLLLALQGDSREYIH